MGARPGGHPAGRAVVALTTSRVGRVTCVCSIGSGLDGIRRVEPGGFRLWVGGACDDEETVATFEIA
ncbi:hypothetical protein [Microbacterium sp. LWH11-1.2]|uniref:hypothetical protein n=1 Tax=unclassified Microbacterium TaxID=2609290 RepID=UPI00313A0357